MDLLADSDLGQSILRMNVQLSKNNNYSSSQTTATNGDVISNDVNKPPRLADVKFPSTCSELCDVEDELSQSVVYLLFLVCWKGVETCDDASWAVRSTMHQMKEIIRMFHCIMVFFLLFFAETRSDLGVFG